MPALVMLAVGLAVDASDRHWRAARKGRSEGEPSRGTESGPLAEYTS
eukprot:CAMPEP_0171156804 /NCGR_PEP_ID=MMETSP0790-20130122/1634_1 /TAXON_ID=2925 /ORGANISM="Alexandrium catenella, Strain OF101" /LENGTH=46 /DNA_ID= /DNA_START= /DNA_END= /DNA_ORIENTATION=